MKAVSAAFLLLSLRAQSAAGLITRSPRVVPVHRVVQSKRSLNVRPAVVIPPEVNLAAGMLAGAIGVGVAYPLDTVKVKTQAFLETAPSGERAPSSWELSRRVGAVCSSSFRFEASFKRLICPRRR